MPAQLLISTPGHPSAPAWVQSEVTRIGSAVLDNGPNSDIEIAGVAPHAATLLFREGHYQLTNRSRSRYRLGQRLIVKPGETVEWRDGAVLEIDGGVRIEMSYGNDPRPVRDATWRDPLDLGAIDREKEGRRRRRNEAWCVALGAVALFCTSVMANRPVPNRIRSACEEVIGEIDQLPPEQSAAFADLRRLVVKGYAAECDGNLAGAVRVYRQARDQLQRSRRLPQVGPAHDAVINYLKQRLAAL